MTMPTVTEHAIEAHGHIIPVASGTVKATHRHSAYGPCVLDKALPGTDMTFIRCASGTALVPASTIDSL